MECACCSTCGVHAVHSYARARCRMYGVHSGAFGVQNVLLIISNCLIEIIKAWSLTIAWSPLVSHLNGANIGLKETDSELL